MQKPKWYLTFSASAARGLPCTQLYRQMFNRDLYLLAYGNIYSNQGAMTPGVSEETADGMSEEKIEPGIAVGTALAGGPPRRSQRALLTHWAPASGSGVEPHIREGMLHAGGW